MLKASEYPAEMKRIREIIDTTDSAYLKNDMSKYLQRLESEYAEYLEWMKKC